MMSGVHNNHQASRSAVVKRAVV